MIPNVCLDFRMFRYIEIVQLFKNVVGNCIGQRQNHILWSIDARLFELEKPTWAQTSSKASNSQFVANSFALVSLKISKNYDDAQDYCGGSRGAFCLR